MRALGAPAYAKLFEADEMSERAADLACADQGNLVTRHVGKILMGWPKSPVAGH